jgi:hypothetical protein
MLNRHILEVASASKGWTVRPLKWHVIWVQNGVSQFGLYLQQFLTYSKIFIVRKDLNFRPSGVSVVLQICIRAPQSSYGRTFKAWKHLKAEMVTYTLLIRTAVDYCFDRQKVYAYLY